MHFSVKLSLYPLTYLIRERICLPFQSSVSRVTGAVTLAPVKYGADDSPEARLPSYINSLLRFPWVDRVRRRVFGKMPVNMISSQMKT